MKDLIKSYICKLLGCNAENNEKSSESRKGGKPNPTPAPIPCGRLLPDVVLTNVTMTVYPTKGVLNFDPVPDAKYYILYYKQANTGNSTTIQVVDGDTLRQATAGYTSLPMYINWGWAPMYINASYDCRIKIVKNDGCIVWSEYFNVSTAL